MKPAFLLAITASILTAQFGQIPGTYPPGQYPGRSPNGGSGVPGGRSRKSTTRDDKPATHTEVVSGVVRKVDADSFELEAEDTRYLIIQFSASVPKPADLRVGDGLDVTATGDADGMFHLVSMKPNKEIAETINENDSIGPVPGDPEERRTGPPPTILVRPNAAPDSDDSGPPVLKHGKPAERASTPIPADSDSSPSRASRSKPAVPAGNPHMALIEQAREAAAEFLQGLPNYVCQEQTTRYVSETRQPSWNVVDVVSAEVVYDDHQESYRNLQINGKPTKKSPEDSGAWSTGEFGTILGNLFAPQSATEFKYVQEDTISHRSTSVFDFKVQRVRSSWKIWVPGQYVVPTYKGSVWIDKQTAQVLRIEMQAKEIPEAFPEISVETAVDYDTISLGTADKFLLPVHAEALSCWRNSNNCQRNVIEFRNYHKFEGESIIKFDQEQK
jgi:predicted transcriptional regulator